MQSPLVSRTERVELAHDGRVGGDLADGEGGERKEGGGELHGSSSDDTTDEWLSTVGAS